MTPSTHNVPYTLPLLRLIPDAQDYQEQRAEAWIIWIAANDPSSPIQTPQMLETQFEIEFFSMRKEQLEQECAYYQNACLEHYDQQIKALLTSSPTDQAGQPRHQTNKEHQGKVAQQIKQLQAERDQQLEVIRGRFGTLLQQANSRIEQAQVQHQQALNLWLEQR
jgi:hypothetical protein